MKDTVNGGCMVEEKRSYRWTEKNDKQRLKKARQRQSDQATFHVQALESSLGIRIKTGCGDHVNVVEIRKLDETHW